MSFLLDTDTISARVRIPFGLQTRFVQYAGRLYLPTPALAELYVLAHRLDDPGPRLAVIERILREDVQALDFNPDCARTYGLVRVAMNRQGLTVAPIDLLIASVALTYDLTLVTGNTKHFERIPGLRLADWLTP